MKPYKNDRLVIRISIHFLHLRNPHFCCTLGITLRSHDSSFRIAQIQCKFTMQCENIRTRRIQYSINLSKANITIYRRTSWRRQKISWCTYPVFKLPVKYALQVSIIIINSSFLEQSRKLLNIPKLLMFWIDTFTYFKNDSFFTIMILDIGSYCRNDMNYNFWKVLKTDLKERDQIPSVIEQKYSVSQGFVIIFSCWSSCSPKSS